MEEKEMNRKVRNARVVRIITLAMCLVIVLFLAYLKTEDITKMRKMEKDFIEITKEKNNLEKKLSELTKISENLTYEEKMYIVVKKLQPRLDPSMNKIITDSILKECKTRNLDPELILAVSFVESGLNPMAESEAGAVGIMQVKYKTWKEQPELKDNGVKAKYHLFWIEANIQCGTTIFRKYYDEAKGDLAKTLWRYNSGKELTGDPLSVNYINRVTYTLALIREIMFNKLQDLDTETLMEPVSSKRNVEQPITKKSGDKKEEIVKPEKKQPVHEQK
jgi:hypothetical protein